MENKLCSNFDETMICGANQTTESCWCFSYPSTIPQPQDFKCGSMSSALVSASFMRV